MASGQVSPAGPNHQLRAAISCGEMLVAVVLGWLVWWCWHRGVIVTVRRDIEMSRIEGRWWAAATGVATLAGILLLDAGRRLKRKHQDSTTGDA